MKVVRLADSTEGAPPTLVVDEIPEPRPGRGELLIRVRAAGAIIPELSWWPTTHRADGQARLRAVPGHEFSGVVAGAGAGAGGFQAGQEVFGMNDWYASGAMAEFCTASMSAVALKPTTLSFAEAASVPISALTAWQGLFDHADLQPGETVLVHGGAGSVGIFAIQLARLHGARVITTASAANVELVVSLGAEQVIDYRKVRFEDEVQPVDVVFDTVGGETLHRSEAVLKPQGRLVTIVSDVAKTGDTPIKKRFFIVEPNQNQLMEVGGLLDAGKLRTIVDSTVPLSQAPGLFAGKLGGHKRGKVVIEVSH